MLANNNPNYFYTSDGVRIFYNTNFDVEDFIPEKGLLVFVYGLVCSNWHWKFQIEYFESLGYQILIHDFRCHYNSSGIDKIEECTFKNISKDLNELLESLRSRKNFLFAHSMGVNVALEYITTYPKYISGISLMSGTVLPPQEIMFDTNIADITLPYIKQISKKFNKIYNYVWKNAHLNPLIRKVVLQGGFNPKTVSDEFVSIYLKRIGELPPELFYQLIEQMKQHDVINKLETIEVPTLIIGGDNDKIIPTKHQYILKKYIKKSKIYILRDGTHVPQVDFPKIINELVHDFILEDQLLEVKDNSSLNNRSRA